MWIRDRWERRMARGREQNGVVKNKGEWERGIGSGREAYGVMERNRKG